MNLIDALFTQSRSRGRPVFLPFLPAGDPSLAATVSLAATLVDAGADMVEIGFPYSDPIADGPVIQASYTRALATGLHTADVLRGVREIRAAVSVPLVGMVSYTLIQRRGLAAFLDDAADAGLSGAVVPDLPLEEANELAALAAARDFKLIQLVTPTTPPERALQIARLSTGFLYCVSVTGITGERGQIPAALLDQLRWLRTQTALPLCVGFGVSTPEHVRTLRDVADGVIVGSALVRKLELVGQRPWTEVQAEVAKLARSLAAALDARQP